MNKPPVPFPHVGLRNLKTALSASLCALIYYFINRNPTFACIGAVYGMGNDMGHSWQQGGNRLIGTIIGGSQAVVALCMPIAMTAIPDEGLPFLAMLMGAVWAAMELSPTHVCAFVAADYYHTAFADLVAKAMPSVILFAALCYGYGRLLMFLF